MNSCMRYENRGSWWHMRYARWNEFGGFIVRKSDRQRMMRRMGRAVSDHRAACMPVNGKNRVFRRYVCK